MPATPDVMLVTMVFPWPSEAFAGVEVRALTRAGARVRVRTLRRSHADATDLLRDWQLADLDVDAFSWRSVLHGCAFMLGHPAISLPALGWLLRTGFRTPRLLVRCLLLTPRMFALFAECRRHPPDVLYLFWGHYPALLGQLVKRWLPDVHVAISFGAYDLLYAFPPSVRVANAADSVWTIAEVNPPAMRRMGIRAPVHVVYRALDLSQVPADCAPKDLGSVVVVARLEENKGVDDALRAFAAVAAGRTGLHLTVIGEGPDRGRLERLSAELGIAGRVRFRGGIGHSEVYRALSRGNIFLLLSRSPAERLPNALKEALACRCLCVVTETPGVRDLLRDLARPAVVAQGDWQAAAREIAHFLDDPGAEGDRDRGREFALRHLDADVVARRRLEVWTAPSARGGRTHVCA